MANPNVRRPDETQKQFRARRKEENVADKAHGKVLWDSPRKGTYVRAKHGELSG